MRFRLRQVCVAAMMAGLSVLAAPSPAHAWWDFIEEFSGPKNFFGWDVQLRLLCFRQATTTNTENGEVEDAKTQGELNTKSGVLLSICRPRDEVTRDKRKTTYKPRAAFDLGARFVWTDDNPHLARGERISLTTLEPAVSIPLTSSLQNKRWDILDYGFGVGVYWFSSEGFESFSGAFLEPLRLDARLPLNNPQLKSIVFRYGLLVFPGGFDRERFNPDRGYGGRISRDWVHSIAVYADLAQLFEHNSGGARSY